MAVIEKRLERKAQVPQYSVAIHGSLSFIMVLFPPSPSPESSSAWLCGLSVKLLGHLLIIFSYFNKHTDI